MSTLYIRSVDDLPHAMDPETPGLAECGEILLKAKQITELQALKFLGDHRCPVCFPAWSSHVAHVAGHRRAA